MPTKSILTLILVFLFLGLPAEAKKYKWEYDKCGSEVYTTGQGHNRTQLIKAWAVAGNADKAIVQAKMNTVNAALFKGIGFDTSTHGMGTSNLRPLVTPEEYREHQALFKDFFQKGVFLQYVGEVNSAYPTGENNMQCPGGRRVGINLVLDYPGLNAWLVDNGVKKGLNGHFNH